MKSVMGQYVLLEMMSERVKPTPPLPLFTHIWCSYIMFGLRLHYVIENASRLTYMLLVGHIVFQKVSRSDARTQLSQFTASLHNALMHTIKNGDRNESNHGWKGVK